MPAPFLSVLIDDCIKNGRDYNAGGAHYKDTFIQVVGIGSCADCLFALRQLVFDEVAVSLPELVDGLVNDFAGQEALRQRLLHQARKYGNDDDHADSLMVRTFGSLFGIIDGRPNTNGGAYRIELPHPLRLGHRGAMPDGRRAEQLLSERIAPVQGADRRGPTAVLRSAGRMDQIKTGGTLLNMKFTPSLLEGEEGISRLAQLVRGYFRMDGHHVQFNVVRAETLRAAQVDPGAHRDLIVRMAGYSDYFCDISRELQEEIISRTEHAGV